MVLVSQFLIANVMRLDGKTPKKQKQKQPTLPKSIQLLSLNGERPSGYNEKNMWETSGPKVKDRSRQRTVPVWAQGGTLEPTKGFLPSSYKMRVLEKSFW